MDGLLDSTKFRDGLRQARCPLADLECAHDAGRRHATQLQGAGEAQHVVPILGDAVRVHAVPGNIVELPVIGLRVDTPEARAADIGEPQTEAISQQPEQAKHDVRIGAGVGHDEGGLQLGLLFEHDSEQHQAVAQRPGDGAARTLAVERDEPCPGMPAAVAPYSKDLRVAAKACFDRRTGAPVPTKFHKSIAQALGRYHLHPEPKYRNADYTDIGRVTPRRLAITHVEHIGKEAHRWEEQLHLGEIPEAQLVYRNDAELLNAIIRSAAEFSQREIAKESGVSLREVSAILRGQRNPTRQTLIRFAQAVRTLSLRRWEDAEHEAKLLGVLRNKIQQLGVRGVARELGIDAENLRKAIGRQRRLTKRLRGTLERATA